jgi:hypothetical protein
MTTPTRRVFVVMAHHWYYNDETTIARDGPVMGFTDRDQAEQYLHRLQRRAAADPAYGDCGSTYTIVEMDLGREGDQS